MTIDEWRRAHKKTFLPNASESKSSSRELTRKHQVILISAMWGSKNALKKFFCSVQRVENTLGTNSRFIAAAAARFSFHLVFHRIFFGVCILCVCLVVVCVGGKLT